MLMPDYWNSRIMDENKPLALKITQPLLYNPSNLFLSWVYTQRLKLSQKHLYIQFIDTLLSTARKQNQPRLLSNRTMNKENVVNIHSAIAFIC